MVQGGPLFLLKRFLQYISAGFLFVLSVFCVLLGFNENVNKTVRYFLDQVFTHIYTDLDVRIIVLTVATIFLLLSLGAIVSAIKFGRREQTLGIDSPYGRVGVSAGAVEDYLAMLKNDIKGVRNIFPKVFLRKGKVKVYMKVSLWSENPIGDSVINIQNGAKEYLEEILGVDRVGEIRVFVGKIIQKRSSDKK